MGGIVRNVVEWGAASLAEAVRMASTVPARVLGLSDRKGRLAPGFDADLVALDNNLNVAMTWVRYPGRNNGTAAADEVDFAVPGGKR